MMPICLCCEKPRLARYCAGGGPWFNSFNDYV
jgi:hypothetical protein